MRLRTSLPFLLVYSITMPLAAQVPLTEPGPYARIVTIVPKPGQAAAFDAGYVRHIEWHRANGDPWTWYGWSFVLGARLGQFMDGTFGHAAADFDRPVDPAGDGADNRANVLPYADFGTHGVYRRVENGGGGATAPDTSAYLILSTYEVEPDQAGAFEKAIAAHRGGGASWYRLILGGRGSVYLQMQGAAGWAEAVSGMEARRVQAPEGTVKNVTTELLRYRATHSYQPVQQ